MYGEINLWIIGHKMWLTDDDDDVDDGGDDDDDDKKWFLRSP